MATSYNIPTAFKFPYAPKIIAWLFILLVISLASCDDEDMAPTINEITIDLTSPLPNESFSISEEEDVNVTVLVQATKDLHQIEITIYNKSDSTDVAVDDHAHGDGIEPKSIDKAYSIELFHTGSYILQVEACGEHECVGPTFQTATRSILITE